MSSKTIVVVLSADGSQELHCGWRVEELFRGSWEASPTDIAEAASRELGAPLQVHALIEDDDSRSVVLRWSTTYSTARCSSVRTEPVEAIASRPIPRSSPSRKRCLLSLVRDDGAERESSTTDDGRTSGIFATDEVTRVTARGAISECKSKTNRARCG